MKKILYFIFVFTVFLQCENINNDTDDNESSAPKDIIIQIQNDYGHEIVVELWSGSNLDFHEGEVLGDNLQKLYTETNLDVLKLAVGEFKEEFYTVSSDKSTLIIVGIPENDDFIYVTDETFEEYPGSSCVIIINLNGQIEIKLI
ncbi:MAG: hypothetical protein OEZ22_03505 [Spirochaetia bacterium]|nr:hypothetical protein [Spirochaetia bacterium]